MDKLPAVAKSFFHECKKCDAERYHTVLTHTSDDTAKIECEVCHSKKTYKLPKAAKKTAAGKTKRVATGPRSAAGKRAKYLEEFEALRKKNGEASARYNMRSAFKENQALEHPKFGLGFVIASLPDKIEVVFEDEVRNLVHNRE